MNMLIAAGASNESHRGSVSQGSAEKKDSFLRIKVTRRGNMLIRVRIRSRQEGSGSVEVSATKPRLNSWDEKVSGIGRWKTTEEIFLGGK